MYRNKKKIAGQLFQVRVQGRLLCGRKCSLFKTLREVPQAGHAEVRVRMAGDKESTALKRTSINNDHAWWREMCP